jgi:hypothetical protein
MPKTTRAAAKVERLNAHLEITGLSVQIRTLIWCQMEWEAKLSYKICRLLTVTYLLPEKFEKSL